MLNNLSTPSAFFYFSFKFLGNKKNLCYNFKGDDERRFTPKMPEVYNLTKISHHANDLT